MRYGRWLTVIAAGITASGIIGLTTSLAWGHNLEEERRLLPGTTIAGIDVGERTADAAAATVRDHLDERFDTEVLLRAGEASWSVSAADLHSEPDVEAAVARALAATQEAGLLELSRVLLLGAAVDLEVDVATGIDGDELDRLIADIAEDVDREPHDATLAWSGEEVELTAARDGRSLDRDDAHQRIASAVLDGHFEVQLPVSTIEPDVATAQLAVVAERLDELATTAIDREITVAAADAERTLRPRELDVEPDVDAVLDRWDPTAEEVEADLPDAPDELPLVVPEELIAAVVQDLAEEVERPARDAELDWSSGRLDIVEERRGRSLDTAAAQKRIIEAIRGGADRVELDTDTRQPAVTADDHEHVLLLHLDRRELQLYRHGEVVREWPVAVGQPGNPTPTGVFTVGAKRVEPTWTNPAPEGWGAGLPEVVGPGPDNPMGPRALNWHRDGRDTLIRFHGTNEPASIGQAASRGCVRMFNDDVIELHDLVPAGTTIISTRG